MLAEVGTSGATQLLGDALGSVRGLADANGTLLGSRSYEAFGSPRTTSGSSSLFGFTGEPTDATGLVHLRARSLDPTTGRMLSADSLIPNGPGTQGYNLYAYAADNPTTWTDPTGHSSGLISAALQSVSQIIDDLADPQTIGTAAWMALFLRFLVGALLFQPGPVSLGVAIAVILLLVAVVLIVIPLLVAGLIDNGSPSEVQPLPDDPRTAPSHSPPPPPPPAPPGSNDCAPPPDGPEETYHRRWSPTQTDQTALLQLQSGEIWGTVPFGGMWPQVQAYIGPLPPGAAGIEFTTSAPPDVLGPGNVRGWSEQNSATCPVPGEPDFVKLMVNITKVVLRNGGQIFP